MNTLKVKVRGEILELPGTIWNEIDSGERWATLKDFGFTYKFRSGKKLHRSDEVFAPAGSDIFEPCGSQVFNNRHAGYVGPWKEDYDNFRAQWSAS